jgi:sugar O-acyltransferase (sialic acid O-acetyltransferase NeuD family)
MSHPLPIVIYGAGGLGSEILVLVRRIGLVVTGFLDDGMAEGQFVSGVQVLGGMSWLDHHTASLILAFGDPKMRRKISDSILIKKGVELSAPLIDPAASLLDPSTIELGNGTILTAGVVLTTRIQIGTGVLINLNSTIGHNTTIGNFTSIMPGCNLAGNVCIGSEVFIGSGATILGGITIGDGALVGAGALVNRNIPPGVKVAGVPAKVF